MKKRRANINKDNSIELWGYTVSKDGKIIGRYGKDLTKSSAYKYIKREINGVTIRIPFMKFIYYAFNQDTFDITDRANVVIPKDMNENNYNLDNLELEKRGTILWGENSVNSKLTDKQVEDIRLKYNKSNEKRDNNPYKKVSYRTLASEYNVSHSLISGIIQGRSRNEDNYIYNNKRGV